MYDNVSLYSQSHFKSCLHFRFTVTKSSEKTLFPILLSTFDNIFIYLLIVAMIQWEAVSQMMTSLLLQYRSICGQLTLNQGTIITNEVL